MTMPKRLAATALLLAALAVAGISAAGQAQVADPPEGYVQVLVNPDFSLRPEADGSPPGWFPAVARKRTENLRHGTFQIDGESGVYLSQDGVSGGVNNNWAQRIGEVEPGRRFIIEADVAAIGVDGGSAFVGVNFFAEESNEMVSFFSADPRRELHGSTGRMVLRAEGVVPQRAHHATVRAGMGACGGRIDVHALRFYMQGDDEPAFIEGMELLDNGSFDGDFADWGMTWYRAAAEEKTEGLNMEFVEEPDRGKVALLEQDGLKGPVFNNWAHEVVEVPAGGRVRLSVDVKTEGAPEGSGAVMVQFWDKFAQSGTMLGIATSQGRDDIGGTAGWRTITLDADVPEECGDMIVRCGLGGEGRLWIDDVSLTVLKVPAPAIDAGRGWLAPEGDAEHARAIGLANEIAGEIDGRLGGEVWREVYSDGQGGYVLIFHVDGGE